MATKIDYKIILAFQIMFVSEKKRTKPDRNNKNHNLTLRLIKVILKQANKKWIFKIIAKIFKIPKFVMGHLKNVKAL